MNSQKYKIALIKYWFRTKANLSCGKGFNLLKLLSDY